MEGEGCFYSTPATTDKNCSQFRLHAAQKQKWPLEKLQELVGGTINGKGTEYYQWTMSGLPALSLALEMFPILSPKRRSQFEMYFTRWEHKQGAC